MLVSDKYSEINPLVSIVTPVFNSQSYLPDTIKSVQGQTYKNWELILIDDYSTDNSPLIAQEAAKKDTRITYIRHESNMGVAASRNTGIARATGQYIAFLDSDDLWDENKLMVQLKFMNHKKCSLSYTAYRKIDNHGNIISSKIPVSETGVTYEDLLKHNEIGCLTAIYDCSVLRKYYFIKTGHEDYVYWLNILKTGISSYGINIDLASYRVHSGSISSNKIKAASYTWNIYRNIEKLPLHKSIYYFTSYCMMALRKYLK